MAFNYIWIVPLSLFIIPLTFVITYFIAVSNGHVASIFPYISDTGALPPESCIFAQLLNIGALLGCVTVYLRHRQICEVQQTFFQQSQNAWITKFSCVFLWIGFTACFGISLVANFQEENLTIVHFTGALTAFLFGLFYGFGQTVLSYAVDRFIITICMAHFRLILVVFSSLFFGLMFSHSMIENIQSNGSYPKGRIPFVHKKVNITDEHYTWYMVSACSEWAFSVCCVLYFITFAAEFRRITVHPPQILLKNLRPKSVTRGTPPTGSPGKATPLKDGSGGNTGDETAQETSFRRQNLHKMRQNQFPELRLPRVQYKVPEVPAFYFNHQPYATSNFYRNFTNYRSFDQGNPTNQNFYASNDPNSSYKFGSRTLNPANFARMKLHPNGQANMAYFSE